MHISRVFTKELKSPYGDQVFEPRRSEIREPDGRVVFSQGNVLVPKDWSQVATDILAQKYFRRTGVPQDGGKKGAISGGETDARQVFHRLAGCWTDWGKRHGYFSTDVDATHFYDELCYMLSHQIAAPNSPQWFNTGLNFAYGIDGPAQGHHYVDPKSGKLELSTSAYARPTPHACFIQGVTDDLVNENGLMDLWVREARVFKYGSGSGTNYSNIRAVGEKLSGGGNSSGLMSFLKVGDRAAGAIKSGGTTRRAAKMVCLDLDHPEVEEFINWKVVEEQKVSALVAGSRLHRKMLKAVMEGAFAVNAEKAEIDPAKNKRLKKALVAAREAGVPDGYLMKALQLARMGKRKIDFPLFDTDWQHEAYVTVSGQNSNNSVRVPNEFFEKVELGQKWALKWRANGATARELPAKDLWETISYATWASADPGIQCDTTINEWHTCPAGGRINGSNPCSEYMFLDDTACNLASINLLKFYDDETGEFRLEEFSHACRLWTMVLEISVLMAQFPSRTVAQKSFDYRTLGLGYANLGALLMSMGIPYGSPEALAVCGALTAIMTGESYGASAEMAKELGPFAKYVENRDAMLRVMRNHRRATHRAPAEEYEGLTLTPGGIDEKHCPPPFVKAARASWEKAVTLGEKHGYRNAQATVIAPTGTIGLLMDCDTTGIEPDFALVKFKKLAGGGYFRIINGSVPRALSNLGYSPKQVEEIVGYCVGRGTLKDAPHVNHAALKAKGFTEEALKRVEAALPTAFTIGFAFTPNSLGATFCEETLGLTDLQMSDPAFNLLKHLGFTSAEIEEANVFVSGTMTVEGAPHLKAAHYAIFDCANKCGKTGKRYLDYRTHIDMMAAAQPFISGAISKTINMPNDATIADVQDALYTAWKKMVKAISIYRDGSKLSQPLNTAVAASLFDALDDEEEEALPEPSMDMPMRPEIQEVAKRMAQAVRRELPTRRFGYTVKATIGGQRVYLRTGEYQDGQLGEVFIDMYKEGAAYRSLMNAFAIAISMGLQYGVPLEEFLHKFHMFRFEPNGHVSDHDNIKFCSSVIDFIFRDLALNYLGRTDLVHIPPKEHRAQMGAGAGLGMANAVASPSAPAYEAAPAGELTDDRTDVALTREEWTDEGAFNSKLARTRGYEGDPCSDCGQFTMVRSGTCMRCLSCGSTSGCS